MMFRTAALAIVATLAFTGCADPELIAKIESLEERVQELENRTPGDGGEAAALEGQARSALQDIQGAVGAGDNDKAQKLCDEAKKKFRSTQTFRRGGRVCDEVAVLGKPVGDLEPAKWFQGQAALDGATPTLLVFWEEWCPHCKREVPKIEGIHKEFQGRLNVVGLTKVNRSSTDEKVSDFLAAEKVTYPVAKEKDGNFSSYYAVTGVPAAALLKDGKVVWRGHPARLNQETLNKLIGS